MAADEPPYLTVGTDVSAKYKGAFCEAKIKKVARVVKCKVTFKNGQGTAVVPDDQITGTLRVGAHVEAKHPDKNQALEAVINKLLDYSQYTVVFDDGDETTLRRTSLCLKSGRHFAESESLDQLPLTNPEHFGTPVIGSKTRRKRNSVVCAAALASLSKRDDDSSEEELPVPKRQPKERRRVSSASTASSASKNVDLGRVVCVEQGAPRGNKKENWFPALIVSPSAQENLRIKFDHLVRSFKDGKYFQVPKKDTKEFTRAMAAKVESPALKTAVEKALTFMDKDELPPNWDRDTLMGLNQQSEDSHDSDSDTSDDEPSEEKDRFVAQLYKFMDERGTPINRAPSVGSRDLNLYKLFKIVQKIGGYNRVTNLNQWKNVFLRLGLPNYSTASSHQTKQAYKKYLHSFEDFFRKLGCTMVSNTRHSRGRYRTDRNLMMTRNRERDMSTSRGKPPYSKSSKKDDEKRKSRTPVKDEPEDEDNVTLPSTSSGVTGIKETSPTNSGSGTGTASSASSVTGSDDVKKEVKIKKERETSPVSVTDEKITPTSPQKDKDKKKYRKSYLLQDVTVDSSDDDVPLSREGSVKLEKEDTGTPGTPVKKEKIKRKDSRDESGSKKSKKNNNIIGEVKSVTPTLEKKTTTTTKKDLKKTDSKDSTVLFPEGESDADSSDVESAKIEKAQGRKYSDGAIAEWSGGGGGNKGPDSAISSKKAKKKKAKEGGPDGDGDDDNDGQETDLEEFELRTGGINIGDKIRVKYGHGGQQKIYEAKVIKIDEKLPKPYYVHYTGWNMRYDEWIRRSRIVENVSSTSVGKKKKSTTTPKLPGQSSNKGSGKRGRPSLTSVHSDSGSSTQSTSLSPASSRKTSSPTSSSRSRQTRSEKTNLLGGLESPKKRGRTKSGATGDARDSDIDESVISDNEDISDKSIDENSNEDIDVEDDAAVSSIPSSVVTVSTPPPPKMAVSSAVPVENYTEPPSLPRTETGSDNVVNKVESDDDQELLMRNEDNKDPLPIKIEEILDMISPLSEDDLPKSFTPINLNSPKEETTSKARASPIIEPSTSSSSVPNRHIKEDVAVIATATIRRKSQEQDLSTKVKDPVIPVRPESKVDVKVTSFNLSSTTDINCSLDEDTESEDEALINLCVPKKDDAIITTSSPSKDVMAMTEPPVKVVETPQLPSSSLETKPEVVITTENTNQLSTGKPDESSPVKTSTHASLIPVTVKEERERKPDVTCLSPAPFADVIRPPIQEYKPIKPKPLSSSPLTKTIMETSQNLVALPEKPKPIILPVITAPEVKPQLVTEAKDKFKVDDSGLGVSDEPVLASNVTLEKMNVKARPVAEEIEAPVVEVDVVEEEEQDEYKFVDETEDLEETERLKAGFSPKKEFKKKRKALKQDVKEDFTKTKPKKKKSDNQEETCLMKDHKATKKIKKNKVNKKRNEKSESSDANSDGKKSTDLSPTKTSLLLSSQTSTEKKKKEKKKKDEKKLIVTKTEPVDVMNVSPESSLSVSEFLKKKKPKKNKEKLSLIEKKPTAAAIADFSLLEKKPKKKKSKLTIDDETVTEGDKSNSEMDRDKDKSKMVKKKKRKSKLKDAVLPSTSTSASTTATPVVPQKELVIPPAINLSTATDSTCKVKDNKDTSPPMVTTTAPTTKKDKKGSNKQEQMVIPLAMNIKEEIVPQEPEPEMSFLLCEEKVPASPVPLDPCPDKDEDEDTDYLSGKLKAFAKIPLASTSTTSFTGGTTTNDAPSTTAGLSFPHFSPAAATVPTSGERTANAAGPTVKQIETEMTTVLDNTPPTTPESSGSLLSSTPPHEDETQERPAEFKLMRTHPTREVECEDTSSRSTDSSSASTSSSGGLTSLSTTLGTDFPKPSYMSKRPKMDLDRHYEALPAKRRRKSGKANEPMKVPASKTLVTATGRPIKQERDAEITAVTSPNASPAKTMECSYSDSLFIDTSPPSTALQSSLIPPLNTASTTIPSLPIRPNRPSKFNFDDPLDDNADANKRINVLQERMTELRKTYMNLKAEVALIDRRRKKAKKKDKHSSGSGSGGASAVSTTSKDNSNHGNGNSGSPNVPLMDAQTS